MRGGSQALRLFIATGILGGFTTFSSYSLEAVLLLERGETGAALAYILGSVVLGLAGLFVGLLLMRAVL
jgi:CrcB protein